MLKPLYDAGGLLTVSLYFILVSSSFKTKMDTPFASQQTFHTAAVNSVKEEKEKNNLFENWNLANSGMSKDAFDLAYKGFERLKEKGLLQKIDLLTIIDFSRSSAKQRLFVVDMITGKLLLQSLVAHGKNSGQEYATQFSNANQSYQSSLGFYITLGTYNGAHGYSLKLKGCESGINDAAYGRAIVMHAAEYVSENFIQNKGYIGRSFGCPAVPEKLNKEIIDLVKNGSCLFIYHPTQTYLTKSKILNG